MEKVSIVLPTYNRANSILRAVESVLSQTYPEFELLIIDDGSTDNTGQVISEIRDERVRYFEQPVNRGVSAARNEGIRLAAYDYIAFQDSDDFWLPDKLEKQMKVFTEKPEAGLVYCTLEGTRADGTRIVMPSPSMPMADKAGNIYERLLKGNIIGAPAAVVRRACLEKVGIFDETLQCLEDWELFLRIAKEYEIGFVEEALLLADIHDGGVSSHVGGYFHTRCLMVARHKEGLLHYGIFNQVVEQILLMAQEEGILPQVAAILEGCLK